MIKNRRIRRPATLALLAGGVLLMWLAPATAAGFVVLGLGVGLEAIGIAMEHRDRS